MNLEEKISVLRANNFELKEFPDYQSDRDVVLEAIKHNPRNLQYASDELQRDDEILSVAIGNLDSEYWRKSENESKEYTYDVDRFLDDMGISVDVLKGTSKAAEALIDSGYFDYDKYYDQALTEPRLGYKDVFGDDFTATVSEDGMQLEEIDEFIILKDKSEELQYELDYGPFFEEKPDKPMRTSDRMKYLAEKQAELMKVLHRMKYLIDKCAEWEKTASVKERISVDSITFNGNDYDIEPAGDLLADILKDEEIMSDPDLNGKFATFKDKCSVAHGGMTITGSWKKGPNGELICAELRGASETLSSSNRRKASVNFQSGEIINYASSISPDLVVDELYYDDSVIDPKLGPAIEGNEPYYKEPIKDEHVHGIGEIAEGVSDRRERNIEEVIDEFSRGLKDRENRENGEDRTEE